MDWRIRDHQDHLAMIFLMDPSMDAEMVQVGTLILSGYWLETLRISAEWSSIVYFSISALEMIKSRD